MSSDKSKDLRLWDIRKDKFFPFKNQKNEIRRMIAVVSSEGAMTFAIGNDSGAVTLMQETPVFTNRWHTSPIRDISYGHEIYLTAEANAPRLCFWRPNNHWNSR